MKILLLGHSGMLGSSVEKLLMDDEEHDVITSSTKSGRAPIDHRKENELKYCLKRIKPDVIINCAAVTSIEKCEKELETAIRINEKVPLTLAEYCDKENKRLIQISTDHYYNDKNLRKLHREDDRILLVNNYAKTKYQGEINAGKCEKNLILRTNITGKRGRAYQKATFFEWLNTAIKSNDRITLFDDFFTSTITSDHLAKFIVKNIMFKKKESIILGNQV